MDTYFPFLVLLSIFVVIVVFVSGRNEAFVSPDPIPKRIYTYWSDTNIPPFIQFCIDSWIKFNPDYQVTVLSSDNYKEYCDIDISTMKNNDSITRSSDFIRLAVLQKNGGIWMDASIISTAPFPFTNQKTDFVGYYMPGFTTSTTSPVIENWLFSCTPNNEFVTAWLTEFLRLNDYNSASDYIESVKDSGISIEGIPADMQDYLACHVAAQKVLQTKMKNVLYKLTLFNANTGPFKYLADVGWDSEKAVHALCNEAWPSPLIKMRALERNLVVQNPELLTCILNK